MNKHLSKYLTADNPLLRNWVRERIHRTDQRYEVIEDVIHYIPKENQYVWGWVDIQFFRVREEKKQKVIYCDFLKCNNCLLASLPALPVCRKLHCDSNRLTSLPELPVCEILICDYNQLTLLPALPACSILQCDSNRLTSLPELPVCVELHCTGNKLMKLPKLPSINEDLLFYGNNPGYGTPGFYK